MALSAWTDTLEGGLPKVRELTFTGNFSLTPDTCQWGNAGEYARGNSSLVGSIGPASIYMEVTAAAMPGDEFWWFWNSASRLDSVDQHAASGSGLTGVDTFTGTTISGSVTITLQAREQVSLGRTNDPDGFPVWDCQFREVFDDANSYLVALTCSQSSLNFSEYMTVAAGDVISEGLIQTLSYGLVAEWVVSFDTPNATDIKIAEITGIDSSMNTSEGCIEFTPSPAEDVTPVYTSGGAELWTVAVTGISSSPEGGVGAAGTIGPTWKVSSAYQCSRWSDPYPGMEVMTGMTAGGVWTFFDGSATETGIDDKLTANSTGVASGSIQGSYRTAGGNEYILDTRPQRGRGNIFATSVKTSWMDGAGENNWATTVEEGVGTWIDKWYDSLVEIDDPVVAPWTAFSLTKIASHSLTANDLNARHFRYLQIPSGTTGSCTVSGQTTSIDAAAIEAGSGTTWVLTRDLNLLTPVSHVYTIPSSVGDYGEVVVSAGSVVIDLAPGLPNLYRLDGVSVSGTCNLVTNPTFEARRWAVDKLMQVVTYTATSTTTTDGATWELYDTNPSTVGVISTKLYRGEQVTVETNGIRSLEYHSTDKVVDPNDETSFVYTERPIETLITDMEVDDGWTVSGGTSGAPPYDFGTLWAHFLTPVFNSTAVAFTATPRYSSVSLYPRNDWELTGTKVFQGAVEGLITNTVDGGAADGAPVSCSVSGSTNSQGWFYLHPVPHTTVISGHIGSTGGTEVNIDTRHTFNPGGVTIALGHREMLRQAGTAAYTWVLMAHADGTLAAHSDGSLVAGKDYSS